MHDFLLGGSIRIAEWKNSLKIFLDSFAKLTAMEKTIILIGLIVSVKLSCFGQGNDDFLRVKNTADFEISGDGSNRAWASANWNDLMASENQNEKTRFKILYSDKGLYFFFHNEDKVITATMTKDFDRL